MSLFPSVALATGYADGPPPPPEGCITISRTNGGQVADTFITDLLPDMNMGTSSNMFVGFFPGGEEAQALVRFGLDAIPHRAQIVSATWHVFADEVFADATTTIFAHRVIGAWDENVVTWNSQLAVDPELASSFEVTDWTWSAVDLSDLVQGWVSGDYANNGFLLEQPGLLYSLYPGVPGTNSSFAEHRLDVCFLPPKAAVGDFVWFDDDGDGLQGVNEPGIPGVALDLRTCAGALVAQAVTDGAGGYLFDGLEGGCYTVEVDDNTIPAGYVLSAGNDPQDASVADSEERLDVDFGYTPLAAIGDQVWLDADGDGLYEPGAGELGLDGVTVTLSGSTGVIAATQTGSGGTYLFGDLPPGTYTVTVTPPAGLAQTFDADGLLDDQTTRVLGTSDDLDYDFGYIPFDPPGTGTPGYWRNHPEAWPVPTLTLGNQTLSQAALIAIIASPTKRDVTYTMAQALIAAKLNVAVGNEHSCVDGAIAAADAWLTTYPVGSAVKASSAAWSGAGAGEATKNVLDAYNNGLLCAPHRD